MIRPALLIAALLTAAEPASPDASAPSARSARSARAPLPRLRRPTAVVTIPRLEDAIPRFRRLFEWASSHRAPKASGFDPSSILPRLDFDPWKPGALDAVGIDAALPAYLWVGLAEGGVVFELPVANTERCDAMIARVLERRGGVRLPLEGRTDASGAYVSERKKTPYVVLREGKSVYFAVTSPRRSTEPAADPGPQIGLAAIDSAKIGVKPKRPPPPVAKRKKDAHLWFDGEGAGNGVDRFTGAAWLDPGRITVDVDLGLDLAGGLLLGDLTGASSSRPLFSTRSTPKPALDATAHLSGSSMATALDALHLPPAYASQLTGDIHVLVSPGGTLLAAAVLRPDRSGADPAAIEAVLAKAKEQVRGIDLSIRAHRGERWLIGAISGLDAKDFEASVMRDPDPAPMPPTAEPTRAPSSRAPIDVTIDPTKLSDALEHLGKKDPALARTLRRAESSLGALIKDVASVHLQVRAPSGLVQTSLAIEYGMGPGPRPGPESTPEP